VRLEQIPEKLQRTFIVAEDCSFYQHEGVDWYEVQQASRQTYERGRIVRGASTISQQLAKNLFLSEDRSLLRKLREFIIVGRLESELSKHRILELYLNCIEYGQGVFGIGMAANRFFGRSPTGLSLSQMVRLAAVLPAPRRLSPRQPSEELERRARLILGRLQRFNYITEQEFQETEGSLNSFFNVP
jgi:monofunctional biosynthetic peptidoglycan transglycosylase